MEEEGAEEVKKRLEKKRRGKVPQERHFVFLYRQFLADLVLVDKGDAALGDCCLLAALAYDVPEFLRVLLRRGWVGTSQRSRQPKSA